MTTLYAVASTALVTAPIILLILAATPFMNKKYAADGRYLLWLVICAALLLPFVRGILPAPTPALQIQMPFEGLPMQELQIVHILQPVAATYTANTMALGNMLYALWIFGIILAICYYGLRHLCFMIPIRLGSIEEKDPATLTLYYDKMKQLLGKNINIELWRSNNVSSPMLIGLLRPKIILPNKPYSERELVLIFRHELTHCARRDIWCKLLMMLIKCLYWFNPAVHLMAKQANKDMETICDERTIRGMGIDDKKHYSELILSMATVKPSRQGHLATSMNTGGKKALKQRFEGILSKGKKRGGLLFGGIGITIAASAMLVGISFAAEQVDSALQGHGEGLSSAINLSHFMPPRGYSWQNLVNLLDENIMQITYNSENIISREINLQQPIHTINADFLARIYVIPSETNFVRVETDALLMGVLDVSFNGGELTIARPSGNILSDVHFGEFTVIHIGTTGYFSDVGISILYAEQAHQPRDINIHTARINPVNVTLYAPEATLEVVGMNSVSFFGESDVLTLDSHSNDWGHVNMRNLPVREANLNLVGRTHTVVNATEQLNVTSQARIADGSEQFIANWVDFIGEPLITEQVLSGRLNMQNAGCNVE
ncbi:MAG: DUF2807 domain-containing protein [Defluviitaleaceae bacterium]|nr:DUF2807 domain-containing protein [Defluviitaleaceae bacterium]